MIHQFKMRLRHVSCKSRLFAKVYDLASGIRTTALSKMPDEEYLRLKFEENTGKKLNLYNPQTYNEKLQWLKLHDRNPLYTTLVDKLAVRKYVAEKIGKDYLVPLLGSWEKYEHIDFDILPAQFVFKCTHDSGSAVICTDINSFDFAYAHQKLTRALASNYYQVGREWPYKNVPPKIIAEKYMTDESEKELIEYKILCFNGTAKGILVITDRNKPKETIKLDLYDMEFHHQTFTKGYPNAKRVISKPRCLALMHELAEILAVGIPHVRVDFYSIEGKVFFGEMTFFGAGGMAPIHPEEWDRKLGSWIDLSLAYGSDAISQHKAHL